MSDTNTNTKTPLWKQLVGAATGAAVAFVVYQGYTFTSEHLTALVTLPQGSGIMDRSGTPTHVWPTGTPESPIAVAASSASAMATASSSVSQNASTRVNLGPFGSVKGLKKFFQFGQGASSSALPPIAVNVSVSSSVSSVTTAGMAPADGAMHLWPTSTVTTPAEAVVPTPPAPVVGRLRPLRGPTAYEAGSQNSDISSTASSSSWSDSSFGVEPPAVTKPLVTGVDWSSSSSSMSAEAITDSIPAEPVYHAPVVSAQKHASKLPQSGFGLDVLAVVAVGSVFGRKRAMKK